MARCRRSGEHRHGYRPQGWKTRVGEIELEIPEPVGLVLPELPQAGVGVSRAIVAVVMEAYVNGVSTSERLSERRAQQGAIAARRGYGSVDR